MTDIKLVIKIDEEIYKNIIENGFIYDEDNEYVTHSIKNSTPIPKGHGRLSDIDWILNKMSTTDAQPITPNEHYAWNFAKALLRKAPTIIEADKTGEK